jgi:hypothetical protein
MPASVPHGTLGQAIDRIHEIFGPTARVVLWTDYVEIVEVTAGRDGVAATRRVQGYLERDHSARLRALTSGELESIAGEFDLELVTLDGELAFRRFARDWDELRGAVAAVAAGGDAAWALVDVGERIDPGTPEPVPALPERAGEVADLLDTLERATGARPGITVDAGVGYDVVADRDRQSGYAQVGDQCGCLDGLEGWLLREDVLTDRDTARRVVREYATSDVPGLLAGTAVEAVRLEESDRTELRVALREGDVPMHAVQAVVDACRKVEETFRARVR